MASILRIVLAAATATSIGVGAEAAERAETTRQPEPNSSTPRPSNPTKNLPSDSGSQTTTPSGAVTGAGHAHGTMRQPDVGAPGGLEPRARAADRATTTEDERREPASRPK
jgi:hypothetical protein